MGDQSLLYILSLQQIHFWLCATSKTSFACDSKAIIKAGPMYSSLDNVYYKLVLERFFRSTNIEVCTLAKSMQLNINMLPNMHILSKYGGAVKELLKKRMKMLSVSYAIFMMLFGLIWRKKWRQSQQGNIKLKVKLC